MSLQISLPATITVGIWEVYADARQAYIQHAEQSGKTASALIADYHGALALIRSGYVHLDGDSDVQSLIQAADQEQTPLTLVGLIVREVSRKIEAALITPPNY